MGKPIAEVNIVLNTLAVSREGFGTPIFIATHKNFQERVRKYSSIEEVGSDFSTESNVYIASQKFFNNSPKVPYILIGRRDGSILLTPDDISNGNVYSLTIYNEKGEGVTVTHVVSNEETETVSSVSTQLVNAIMADVGIASSITATGSSSGITIVPKSLTNNFDVKNVVGLIESYTNKESAIDSYSKIKEENNNFYFVTAEDHTVEYVDSLANAVSTDRKIYFTSSQEPSSLNLYSVTSTDTLGVLKNKNYKNVVGIYHQNADTEFVECLIVGYNAPYSPDQSAVVWDGLSPTGVEVSKNLSGNEINSTQMSNLENRDASYFVNTSAGLKLLGGKTANGTWIDELQITDCMVARISEELTSLILNQKGKKLNGGKEGKAKIESAIITALTPFISSNAIVSFAIDLTKAVVDTTTRKLNNVRFTAVLEGAILRVQVNGELLNQ